MIRLRKIMKILKKIKRKDGETLVETLVALLIAAIGLTILASMITTTSRLVKTSKDKMDTYYSKNIALDNPSGTGTSKKVTVEFSGAGSPSVSETEYVSLFTNGTFSGDEKSVYAYFMKSETSGSGGDAEDPETPGDPADSSSGD